MNAFVGFIMGILLSFIVWLACLDVDKSKNANLWTCTKVSVATELGQTVKCLQRTKEEKDGRGSGRNP